MRGNGAYCRLSVGVCHTATISPNSFNSGVSLMSKKLDQYRPCFNYLELTELVSLLPQSHPLFLKLSMFKYKIDMGLNAPAFATAPRQSLEQSIGAEPENNIGYTAQLAKVQSKANYAPQLLTAADKYELLGNKAITGTITEEEKAEGRALELELYQMDMGTFT